MSRAGALSDRVVVITGGTGAIGAAIAHAVGAAGGRIALVARDESRLESGVARLEAVGVEATGLAADVLDVEALETVRASVIERFGAVHGLVCCAGGNVGRATLAADASPFSLSADAYRDVFELNLTGTILPVNVFGSAMEPPVAGSIVTVASMAAQRALTGVGGYGAAKAAIESLTRWLAVELGRRGTGIRVNALAPGFVVGAQNRDLLLSADGTLTDRGRAIVARTPLGRLGEPGDLGSTAVWLLSDGARFVTGAVIPVDGGFSAWTGV